MRKFTLFLIAVVVLLAVQNVKGDLITFVKINPDVNTEAVDGGSFWSTSTSESDGLWRLREPFISYDSCLLAGGADGNDEDVPVLATTISGLAFGVSYNIYGYAVVNDRWDIQFGLSDAGLVDYGGSTGDMGTSLSGVDPSTHFTGGIGPVDDYGCEISLGIAVADVNGEIKVYVNESTASTCTIDSRTVYGGVGYSVVPEPSVLALLVSGLIGLLCYAWRKRK